MFANATLSRPVDDLVHFDCLLLTVVSEDHNISHLIVCVFWIVAVTVDPVVQPTPD